MLGNTATLDMGAIPATPMDTIVCTATATDSDGASDSSSTSVTISNTAPVVDSISMSPSAIDATTNSVGCNPVSSDLDGDTVTHSYAWYIDGVLQSGSIGNTFLENWVAGTEVTCRATPNDGTVDGNYVEVSVIVDNTAPVVSSITLSPTTVYTNDTITATAVLSDSDSTQVSSLLQL